MGVNDLNDKELMEYFVRQSKHYEYEAQNANAMHNKQREEFMRAKGTMAYFCSLLAQRLMNHTHKE